MSTSRNSAAPEGAEILLLGFVRGEQPISALETAGVFVALTASTCQADNPWGLVLRIAPRDVALGLLALARDAQRLQRWAQVVLGGSSFLEFSDEFEEARGDDLKGLLWDLAFGQSLDDSALTLARLVLSDTGSGRGDAPTTKNASS